MRMDSSMTLGEDSPPTNELVQLRDALTNIYYAHKTNLPTNVRDGALRALQTPTFLTDVEKVECLDGLSHHCVAFCILNSILRVQQRNKQPSFVTTAASMMNVPIAQKLQLDLAVAEEAIQAIMKFVPSDVASGAEQGDDDEDDLFA